MFIQKMQNHLCLNSTQDNFNNVTRGADDDITITIIYKHHKRKKIRQERHRDNDLWLKVKHNVIICIFKISCHTYD